MRGSEKTGVVKTLREVFAEAGIEVLARGCLPDNRQLRSISKNGAQNSPNDIQPKTKPKKRKRPAPLSVRLSAEERARLERDADGMSLNAYIRACLFGDERKKGRKRRSNRASPIKDHKALAQVLSVLGHSYIAQALTEVAEAHSDGRLHLSHEERAEFLRACSDIRLMRGALIVALGLQAK